MTDYKKIIDVMMKMRIMSETGNLYAATAVVRGMIVRADIPEIRSSHPRVLRLGNRSTSLPPIKAPMLMPASITPMMLVHVYMETPTNGARMRPATISMTRLQKLAVKVMM